MPEGEDARGQRLINSISSGGVVLHPSAESVSKVSGTSSRCARQFLSRLRYQPSTLSGARERTFLKLTAFSRLYLDSNTCFIQGRFGHCFAGPSPVSRLARPCATIANATVVEEGKANYSSLVHINDCGQTYHLQQSSTCILYMSHSVEAVLEVHQHLGGLQVRQSTMG
jgi:hypothetical protein